MSELKLISPLLDGMEIEKCIQSGGGTSVYLLQQTATRQSYILKHISVPESQTQVDALIFTGAAASTEDAQAYYEQIIEDYKDEFDTLRMLRGSANLAIYNEYQIVPKEDGVGFEVYLLSNKWQTLTEYLSNNAMTHLRALNLGLDLCSALCDLRVQGLIHRNIKPENIYLDSRSNFMLGDLGIAKIDNLKYCAMPERMVSEYTAPEMTDILNTFNTTIDIYSIGMILYRILNGNHGPFEDEKTSAKAANKLRISGEPLPAPLYSDYELTEIILKACAFEPSERYQTPDELKQELILYMKRNYVSDSLIVPPIVIDNDLVITPESMDEEIEPVRFADVQELDDDFVSNFSPDTQALNAIIREVQQAEAKDISAELPEQPDDAVSESDGPVFATPPTAPPADDEPSSAAEGTIIETPKKSKAKLLISIAAAIILIGLIAVSLYFLVFGGPPLHIDGIQVVDKGTDYLSVAINTAETSTPLSLHCIDSYGNELTMVYVPGQPVTFSDLASGTQYTISVVSDGNKKLSGDTSLMVTTIATTEVVSFTATSFTVGQADLNLIISGPSPEEWTVRYYADGVDPQEVSFTGNTVSIFNLEENLPYTFELVSPDGIAITGQTALEFSTGPEIQIQNLEIASLTKNAVSVTWEAVDSEPSEWSVTCTGTDGSTKTQTVQDCSAEFTELMTGETYTITVTSAGTLTPASITATPTAATITAMEAAVQEDGSIIVTWQSDVEASSWQLLYTVEDSAVSSKLQVEGVEATLSGLIPGETYTIEIRSALGEKLGGTATASVDTPTAEKFDAYGASRFFMGMFLRPDKANWTGRDLAVSSVDFTKDQKIAFAVESLTGRDSSDDTVQVVYVVEDSMGIPVSTDSYTAEWDSVWNDELFVGELSVTPQEAGNYTLRLYFNGRTVASKEFTVR